MNKTLLNYVLGLDLGIASVGWSVVKIDKDEYATDLIDCGVRTFEKAEVPKTGESLALSRRLARSSRRLIRRRAHRLERLKRFFHTNNILSTDDFQANSWELKPIEMTWLDLTTNKIVCNHNKADNQFLPIGVWGWRVLALEQKLSPQQWAHVLLHIIKHRGYLSQRKNEAESADKELGRLLSGVAENSKLLQEKQYRTAAELAVKNFAINTGHLRNQKGDYSHTFNRLDIKTEVEQLFKQQRALGNQFAADLIETKVLDLLMTQRDALSGNAILEMLGKCSFELEEYKAAKACYSAERFIWLSKLNNLRLLENGIERKLTDEERLLLINEPYIKAQLKYAQVRRILELSDDTRFNLLRYPLGDNDLKAENSIFMEMKAYHAIRKALESSGLKTEWTSLANNYSLLDDIGTAFSVYKTDTDIKNYLEGKIAKPLLDVLLAKLSFAKFINLSLTAINKLMPLLENGQRYDQACTEVYGSHSQSTQHKDNILLPVIPVDDIKNPVVIRSLSQTRKVINAIIRQYGSPARIHIETARELGRSFKDRREIEKNQQSNQAEKERSIQRFKEFFPYSEPKAVDILKMRLYEAQHGKCIYTGDTIEISRLNEVGYVEIDHALPFSRTWDNSFNNKVLVLKQANQNKGNKTPFEWFNGKEDSDKWQHFEVLVKMSAYSFKKKEHLLKRQLDEDKFISRNLNDTRYISRFICQFIENNLLLTGQGTRKVFASNGQITAFLRGSWGLAKVRENNDRHHALDAIVVACSTPAIQKKITDYNKYKELNPFNREWIDTSTGEIQELTFPKPWKYFSQEVNIRVFSDNPIEEITEKLADRKEALHQYITPLFVSRAPARKASGQGHKETIKSAKLITEGLSISRVPLNKLKLKDIENIVGYDTAREANFYAALRQRLNQYNDNPELAFSEPFYKTNLNGEATQLVKYVRVKQVQKSGVQLPKIKAIADNADMVRIDIFEKNGKNYIVPVYTWQIAIKELPNKVVLSGKNESDWEEITNDFTFKFSLYPNDLIEVITSKNIRFLGYYAAFDRATGLINIKEHDLDINKGKDGLHRSIGVRSTIKFIKYEVDILGKKISPVHKSSRKL